MQEPAASMAACNMRVVVRVRPALEREATHKLNALSVDAGEGRISLQHHGQDRKAFSFDKVLDAHHSQVRQPSKISIAG